MKLVVGIDVGGTNTDAVLVGNGQIIAWAKVPTTWDVYSGIVGARARIPDASVAARVHIGTTAFTNALVERRELASVAAIRAGKPVSESLPPMTDWPDDLQAAIHNRSYFISGGREYDGRPISPLDRDEVKRIARELAQTAITQVAVTSVFGTSYPDDEVRVATHYLIASAASEFWSGRTRPCSMRCCVRLPPEPWPHIEAQFPAICSSARTTAL